MPKKVATIINMASLIYTNSTVASTYNEQTGKYLNQELTTENIFIKNPVKGERSIRFMDDRNGDNKLSTYFFYNQGDTSSTIGFYDALGPRAIWRSILGSTEMTFAKSIVSENNLDVGSSDRKWRTVYATNGSINTSDATQKENISPINGLAKGGLLPVDFTNFVKNTNFVTYDWKDKEVQVQGFEKQVGFLAQEVCEDKVGSLIATGTEYSLNNLVMSLGVALQDALKRIEELESK